MKHTKVITEPCYNAQNRVYDNERRLVAEPPRTGTTDERGVKAITWADCERARHIAACLNACANLPEPEKNIKELVEAARERTYGGHAPMCEYRHSPCPAREKDVDENGEVVTHASQGCDNPAKWDSCYCGIAELQKALAPFEKKEEK
jgi:hypothetical protein